MTSIVLGQGRGSTRDKFSSTVCHLRGHFRVLKDYEVTFSSPAVRVIIPRHPFRDSLGSLYKTNLWWRLTQCKGNFLPSGLLAEPERELAVGSCQAASVDSSHRQTRHPGANPRCLCAQDSAFLLSNQQPSCQVCCCLRRSNRLAALTSCRLNVFRFASRICHGPLSLHRTCKCSIFSAHCGGPDVMSLPPVVEQWARCCTCNGRASPYVLTTSCKPCPLCPPRTLPDSIVGGWRCLLPLLTTSNSTTISSGSTAP